MEPNLPEGAVRLWKYAGSDVFRNKQPVSYQYASDVEYVAVPRAEFEALKDRAEIAEDARDDLRQVLKKIVAHTGHLPAAPRELLVGLLASCARIANSAILLTDAAGDAMTREEAIDTALKTGGSDAK